jgi:hypothetical protein
LIFVVFMVSGIAKLFPIWAFEKQIVDLGIASWCYAHYLSRFLIACEISIGILMLQPHYLKKIVIPVTILLLLAFCVHLTFQMIDHGAMSGNCGCFGQLIPMTPLEAFIKNIVSIALLIVLYKYTDEREKGSDKFIYLLLFYLAVALVLYVFFPFCPCKKEIHVAKETQGISVNPKRNLNTADSLAGGSSAQTNENNTAHNASNLKDKTQTPKESSGPKKTKTRYSDYTTFSSQTVDLDEGKKIICFFSAGCDHCRAAVNEITALSKKIKLPPVYIFFMDEETDKISSFFKEAGATYPYKILDVPIFWKLLGDNADTPGVIYLWNGNVVRYYEGLDNNKFNIADLENACKM